MVDLEDTAACVGTCGVSCRRWWHGQLFCYLPCPSLLSSSSLLQWYVFDLHPLQIFCWYPFMDLRSWLCIRHSTDSLSSARRSSQSQLKPNHLVPRTMVYEAAAVSSTWIGIVDTITIVQLWKCWSCSPVFWAFWITFFIRPRLHQILIYLKFVLICKLCCREGAGGGHPVCKNEIGSILASPTSQQFQHSFTSYGVKFDWSYCTSPFMNS